MRNSFLTSEGGRFDLILAALPNAPSILGRDSSLPIENLAISKLGAEAKSYGISVAICDGDEQGHTTSRMRELVFSTRSSVLGLTSYQSNIIETLRLAEDYKALWPESTICLGGYQATFCAAEILKHEPYIDIVVVGRGERILPQLVLAKKSKFSPRGIFQEGIPNDLPPLPTQLQRNGSSTMLRYWPAVAQRKSASIISSEGCVSNCAFCATPKFERLRKGGPWRPRQPEDVLAEIDMLIDTAGIEAIHFHDPDFLGMTKYAWVRARAIAEGLKLRDFTGRVRFTAQARAVSRLPLDFWKLWRSVGLERVFVGLENGLDTVLKTYRKSSRAEDNRSAVTKLKNAGIALQAGFIMITPTTTPEEMRQNIDFLRQVDQSHYSKHYCNLLKIYPGSSLFPKYDELGLIEYKRSYLPISIKYSHAHVGEVAQALNGLAPVGYPIDRFFWDLEFGFASRRKTILTEFGCIMNCCKTRTFFFDKKTQRASYWAFYAKSMLGESQTRLSHVADLIRRREGLMLESIRNFAYKCQDTGGMHSTPLRISAETP